MKSRYLLLLKSLHILVCLVLIAIDIIIKVRLAINVVIKVRL
jgi:hypothetical protein